VTVLGNAKYPHPIFAIRELDGGLNFGILGVAG
jgi:hypothetical protein